MNFRIDRKIFNNFSVAVFLLVVLFFPKSDAFFRMYFAAVLSSAVLLLGSKRMYFDWLTLTGIGVLLISVISILLRFGFIVSPNMRDYTEFSRLLLPVVMLVFRDKFKDVDINTLFIIFAIYCSIDCLVSVLDFAGIEFLGIVDLTNSLYVTSYHAAKEFRIDGLSAGPGQHGITMLMFFTFFYIRAFQSKGLILPSILSIVSAIPLFLSQSRTSIISLIIISFAVPLFFLFKGDKKEKKRSLPVLGIVMSVGIYLFTQFMRYFGLITELSAGMEGVSSIRARMIRYSTFFDKASDHPLFFFIGYGKDFFDTSAFDNEYIFLFLVHGPAIALIIIGGTIIFLFKTILVRDIHRRPYRLILFFLLIIGLIAAYPSSFFLRLSNIPLILLFVNLTFWENRQLNRRKINYHI